MGNTYEVLNLIGNKLIFISKLAIHIDWHKLTWVVAIKFVINYLFYVFQHGTMIAYMSDIVNTKQCPTNHSYSITKDGRVYSYHSKRYLRQADNGYGYKFVNIGGKSQYVHRLVAMAYLGIPDDKHEVNHIDGNKSNNTLDNLEWVTHSSNLYKHHGNDDFQDKLNKLLSDGIDADVAIYCLT